MLFFLFRAHDNTLLQHPHIVLRDDKLRAILEGFHQYPHKYRYNFACNTSYFDPLSMVPHAFLQRFHLAPSAAIARER